MKYDGSGISSRTNQVGVVSLVICVGLYPALFGQNAYWVSIGNFIAIYSIFAVATCYLFGYGRQILLSCSGFYALGAYGSALLTTKLVHLNPWLAMVLTALGTGLIAFILSFVIFRLKHLFFAMVTMVFTFLIFDLLKESDGVTGGLSGIPGIPPLSIAGFQFNSEFKFYCLIWGAALIVLVVFMNIIDSKEGRALRAIGSDDIAAEASGVDTTKYLVRGFVISAVFTSIAGSFYAHYVRFIDPYLSGLDSTVLIQIMLLIGGAETVWSGVVGAAIIVFLTEGLRAAVPLLGLEAGPYEKIFYGLMIMLVIIFAPQGLLPSIRNFLFPPKTPRADMS